MNITDSKSNFDSELDWLAFRYVSGELTASESSGFEMKMAEDQSAREALANAVELSESIARSGSTVIAASEPVSHKKFNPLVWASIAASIVVCLAILNVARMMQNEKQLAKQLQRNQQTAQATAEADAYLLAEAWTLSSELLKEPSITDFIDEGPGVGELIQEIDGQLAQNEQSEFAPGWMLAGLVHLSEDSQKPVQHQEVQTP